MMLSTTSQLRPENYPLLIHPLQRREYHATWQAMRLFTAQRTAKTPDEIWFIEHDPVYTLGQGGQRKHILNPGHIPIINTDRGGQVTYHGPGQLVVYLLLDLRRLHLAIRALVNLLEDIVIALLADYKITGLARREAPGVYVESAKLASIGLRICRGCCYHGLAINVSMDLKPFLDINPCGFATLAMTQLRDLGGPSNLNRVAAAITTHLRTKLTQASFPSNKL